MALHDGFVRVSEAVAETGAEVIGVDVPAELRHLRLDGADHRPHRIRGLDARLPTGTPARGALDGLGGTATNPQGHGPLHRLGRDGGLVKAHELAVHRHGIFRPQAGERLQLLIHAPAAALGRRAGGGIVPRAGAAQAEGRQQAAFGQHVDGGALLGGQHRVAQAEARHVHAELEPPRSAGEGRHHAHALQVVHAGNEPVGLPDGIDAPALAQIHPLPEASRVLEGEAGDADAYADGHGAPKQKGSVTPSTRSPGKAIERVGAPYA